MLKKSASGVFASLRGSTYQSVRLTSSLAAALLDSLFEHPAGDPALSTYLLPVDLAAQKLSFSANCDAIFPRPIELTLEWISAFRVFPTVRTTGLMGRFRLRGKERTDALRVRGTHALRRCSFDARSAE
jgi:hypothetical protein